MSSHPSKRQRRYPATTGGNGPGRATVKHVGRGKPQAQSRRRIADDGRRALNTARLGLMQARPARPKVEPQPRSFVDRLLRRRRV